MNFLTSPSAWVRSIAVCMFVCLSVRLSARIPQKPHIQISRNFMHLLPVTVARSSSESMRYVMYFRFVWMASCFHNFNRWNKPKNYYRMTRTAIACTQQTLTVMTIEPDKHEVWLVMCIGTTQPVPQLLNWGTMKLLVLNFEHCCELQNSAEYYHTR